MAQRKARVGNRFQLINESDEVPECVQLIKNRYIWVCFQEDGILLVKHRQNPNVSLKIDLDENGKGLLVILSESSVAENQGEALHVFSKT